MTRIVCPGHRDLRGAGPLYDLAAVQVYTVDADQFLRGETSDYDVAIIDFPDPRSVELAKLFSVEFYAAVKRHLSSGAVLSVQSTNPRRAKLVFTCIGASLQSAGFSCLPYHDYVPSFGEWGWYLAWHDSRSEEDMLSQFEDRAPIPVETQYVTPDLMRAAFVFGRHALDVEETVRANTKFRPVILAYYQRSYR